VIITVEVTPVPLNASACGLPVALSEISNVAVRAPAACGVNNTLIVQLAPPASVPAALHPPLVFGCGTLKSSASAPLVVNPVKFTAAVPGFVTITLNGALVVLTAWLPNVNDVGAIVIVPAGVVLNVAVTVTPDVAVETVHEGGDVCGLAGTQFALKLAKVEPTPAVAVSTTVLLPPNVPVQVVGQLIPAGALATVPVPEPLSVTVTAAAPMPDRVTVCTLPAVGASSEIVIVPV
jgi:hypothetical protein